MSKRAIVFVSFILLVALTACDTLGSSAPDDEFEEEFESDPEDEAEPGEGFEFEPEDEAEAGDEPESESQGPTSEDPEESGAPTEPDADPDAEDEVGAREIGDQPGYSFDKIPPGQNYTLYYNGGTIICAGQTIISEPNPPEQGRLDLDPTWDSLTMIGTEIEGTLYFESFTNNGSIYQGFVDGPEGTLIDYELQYVFSPLSVLSLDDTAIAYGVSIPDEVLGAIHNEWLIGTFDTQIAGAQGGGGSCTVQRNFIGVAN
jgi:hypothetical protein